MSDKLNLYSNKETTFNAWVLLRVGKSVEYSVTYTSIQCAGKRNIILIKESNGDP